MEPLELAALLEPLEQVDLQEPREQVDLQEPLERVVLLVTPEQLDLRETQEQLDLRETQEQLDLRETQEQLVLLERRGHKEKPEQQVHKVYKGQQDLVDLLELMDPSMILQHKQLQLLIQLKSLLLILNLEANGISVQNGSEVTIPNVGTYKFTAVLQVSNISNATQYATFWLRLNGVDYPNSGTNVLLQPRKSSSEPYTDLVTIDYIGTSQSANDYIEIWWDSESTDVSLQYTAATATEPAIPSIICGISQVMYTQVGPTGATGPDGATGADTSKVGIYSTGSNYTLALTDAGNLVEITGAATVTVPPNSSVAFPTGSQILVVRATASAVDIAAGSGVTINSANSYLDLNYQYSSATLIKRDTNEWYLFGDLKA
jgi:hypothetical protein